MANSNVGIANLALTGIGASRITSLTEDSENARKVNAIYYLVRDQELNAHPWNFATERVGLALLATAPVYGYDNAFQIPSDCLRVWGSDLDALGIAWEREGETIVTNEGSIKIKYIKRVTDPNKFSPAFVMAFAARLEAELAYPIMQDATLANNKFKIYTDVKLPMAKSMDAQEGRKLDAIQGDSWIDSRNSGQP